MLILNAARAFRHCGPQSILNLFIGGDVGYTSNTFNAYRMTGALAGIEEAASLGFWDTLICLLDLW